MADFPPADISPPAGAAPDADVAERITVGVPPASAYQAGRIFTGRVANNRAEANREGMRTTLARLKQNLEAG